jgi:hypothetical protein
MKFPVHELKCIGGVIYPHLFENSYAGIERDLYWSMEFDFEPLIIDGDKWDAMVSIEWLRFPRAQLSHLKRHEIEFGAEDPMIEASFYFVEHETPKRTRIILDYVEPNRLKASLEMVIDFPPHMGFEETPDMRVSLETTLDYMGMIIVPANLEPVPASEAEVIALAVQYIDLDRHQPPVFEKFRYVFRTKK